ncbi:cupin domain-containing protein [Loigolactobacillus jiayinensis]|uniref:Cupin domain-containing protein n=1 Tax=Loigolactobacillus jiayinensis TaxID=2486016 RepID=A0ABW1RA12_9LACO|nr:cupin domain-containing protein [Loigolactobacillus jiayinensis]
MRLDLKNLINYHDEQISSRFLSDKIGTSAPLTLYAFAANETISNEVSQLQKVFMVLEGQLQVSYATTEREEIATAGELIIVPANEAHNLKALTPCKYFQLELPSNN